MRHNFASPYPTIQGSGRAFRPPLRISVSDGAARTLFIAKPGATSGYWSKGEAPYIVEPMDQLASRVHEAVCFVGPSQSGKTMGLINGWMAHNICHDPGDMLIVQMTQEKAREHSKKGLDRAIRNSQELREMMSSRRSDDNTYDKLTKHGMWIKIGWPSATQFASTDYRYVALTDYDRFPDDIDGEGSGFVQGSQRTKSYLSRGMCLVESSPGRDIEDPTWKPSTPHEPPPVSGVLGIYMQSDRRRWYWKCVDCGMYFEASPGIVRFATLPSEEELLEIVRVENLQRMAREHALVCCPHCGTKIAHKWKPTLNDIKTARWVPDGQTVTDDGELIGEYHQSAIAGYWLGGIAAAFQSWESILVRHLQALREYAMTGSESTLKSRVNTEQSMAYLPRHLAEQSDDSPEERAEAIERFYVPSWTRFMLCAVDVQGGQRARFVVQVHAIGVDMESAIVDRYDITQSPRGIDTDTGEVLQDIRIDPASYPEDWQALTDRVINATYRVDDERELQVYHTVVDYGGEDGVSVNAAAWRQNLRTVGLADRVTLGKGDGRSKEMVQRTIARDRNGRKMRDVPLMLFSSDKFKDLIFAAMRRSDPGPTFMHFPKWLKRWFYDELRAEVRQPNGKYKKVRARNEGLDCWAMIWAAAYMLGPADPRRPFDWESPPAWAAPLDRNSHVLTKGERRTMQHANASAFQVF